MSSRLKQSELLASNPSSSVYTILYAWMFPALKVTCRYCMLPCSYLPDAQSTGSRHVLIVPTGSVCRCKHSVVSFVSDGLTWHASGMCFTSASAKSSLLTSYSQTTLQLLLCCNSVCSEHSCTMLPSFRTSYACVTSQEGHRLCRLVPHSSSSTPLPAGPGQVPGHSQCDAALCLCSVLESQLPELATCAEEVTLKHLLWTSLQSWEEVTQELSRTEFSQVDAEQLEAVVGQYARTALKIEKGLSPNQVRNQILGYWYAQTQLSLSLPLCVKHYVNCLQPKTLLDPCHTKCQEMACRCTCIMLPEDTFPVACI